MVTADKVIEGVTSRSKTLDTAWSWITTVDHKRIGILYMVTAIIFFFGAGIEALVMRTQLARPDSTLVEAETFNQMFTMHALSMIFLGVMPMSVAFFNLIVPLAIGARDVAFPRLNALSYWIFLFGGLLPQRWLHIWNGFPGRGLVRLCQPDGRAVLQGSRDELLRPGTDHPGGVVTRGRI